MTSNKKQCCPSDQQAAIVTMRPANKDPWFAAGVKISFSGRQPDGSFSFRLAKNGDSSPEVATVREKGRIPLPDGAVLLVLCCKGTRVMLAICYRAGTQVIRAKKPANVNAGTMNTGTLLPASA